MEFVIGLIVFIADVYAIMRIINSPAETSAKILWVLVVAILPVIGFVAWYFAGPK